jgi:hypothetical protein
VGNSVTKGTNKGTSKVPVEVLLTGGSEEVAKIIFAYKDTFFCLSEVATKGKKAPKGFNEVWVIAAKFDVIFRSKVCKLVIREIVSLNESSVIFKEEGGVKVVELDLT